MLKRLAESSYLSLVSGVILLVAAGYEIYVTFDEVHLGVHHGVAFFGLTQIVKSIPEFTHGIKEVNEGEEGLRR